MYQIALCDDDSSELDKVEAMLRSYQEQCMDCDFFVERFTSADELIWIIQENNYMPDLLLLDIYMPKMPGIEAAKKIRSMGYNFRIIFLTISTEFALDAYRVEAFQYLIKPLRKQDLFPVLDKLIKCMAEEKRKYLLLRAESKIRRVALCEIVFCEAQKKCQCIYLSDGSQLLIRMTMAKIFEMLSGYTEFVRAGIAYIINLKHIESLNAREIQMDNGKKIYLPRGSYQPLKEQYFDYYCEEV